MTNDFLVLILNYMHNRVKNMFRLSFSIFSAFLFSVYCLQRKNWYSRLDKEMTTSSLAVLHGEVSSIVHCAELCSEDDYCMEFLYSDINRQCIRLHCVKKESYSYQYVVLGSTQMLHYEKGN